ncbi:uncharacterized protein [Macrobrachium rosenbergii]|uniref:uncharacterized protein n=1 Tax=Macrobrachium rosenbergii TaxID=79674 RepID=UPI0034D587C7
MMASLISQQFVIVLLSLFCGSVSGLLLGIPNFLGQDQKGNSTSDGTRGFRRDVISALSALIGQSHRYLQLLYDVRFEDDVYDITQFSKTKNGLMVHQFDGTDSQLDNILVPVESPTVLLLLCRPKQITDMFRTIRRRRLNSHYVLWIVMLRDEEEGDYVMNGLEGLVFEGTRVILVVQNAGKSYGVFSSRVDTEGTIGFFRDAKLDLATTSGREGLKQVALRDDSASYRNMKGREMRIAAVNNFGLCNLLRLPDGRTYPSTGIDVAMMKTLSYALNFTIRIVDPPDGAYGNPLPNGSVTGMIGMVARREADFAICAISLSALRKTVVDFPYPYFRSPLGLFSRAPKEKSRVLAILSPFTAQVWLGIVVAVLFMGPVIAIQSKVSSAYVEGCELPKFQVYSFNVFRSIVFQGNLLPTTTLAERVVFVSWYLFCLVVSVLYSGMLTAVLAIPAFEAPIDYLTDLPRAVKEGFDIGVYKDTTNELLFREAKDGIYAQTWKLFNHKNPERSFVRGNAPAMDEVVSRDFVYIGFMASCEILSTKLGRSKIHIGKETFFSSDIGLATPPGSPYTKTFGDVTLRLIKAGLRTKWKAEEESRLASSVPKEEEKSDTYAITLSHLQVLLHVMALVLLGMKSGAFALNPMEILRLGPSPLRSLHEQFANRLSQKDNGGKLGTVQEPEVTEEVVSVTTTNSDSIISPFGKQGAGDSVLGSLFELGMSDIGKTESPKQKNSPSHELLNEILELPFLPLTKDNGTLPHVDNKEHTKSPLLQYLDMIRGDAWAQFKSLALSYSNWLEDEYQIQDISDKLPIGLIKKVLDLGDRVNFLHVVGKKVDSGLAVFLADEMKPLFDHFDTLNPGRAFGSSLSTVINNIVRDTAWKTMHQFIGHVLSVAERFVSRKDIEDFQADLAKSSPLVAKGLDVIINGPPTEGAGGRSLMGRKGYHDGDYGYKEQYSHKDNYGHKDPYGHKDHYVHEDISYGYGGYGSFDEGYGVYSQGYKSGVFLDPYLILGGLGAAALLAYLAYKVIVTTAAARRRRSDDLTFMELSDMPNLVYSFYSLLEGADEKYGGVEPVHLDDTEDLVSALNSLWHEREEESGCIRCSLYSYAQDHFSLGHNAANALLVAGIAHALGADRSGQLLDEVGSVIVEGQPPMDCLRRGNTCYVK